MNDSNQTDQENRSANTDNDKKKPEHTEKVTPDTSQAKEEHVNSKTAQEPNKAQQKGKDSTSGEADKPKEEQSTSDQNENFDDIQGIEGYRVNFSAQKARHVNIGGIQNTYYNVNPEQTTQQKESVNKTKSYRPTACTLKPELTLTAEQQLLELYDTRVLLITPQQINGEETAEAQEHLLYTAHKQGKEIRIQDARSWGNFRVNDLIQYHEQFNYGKETILFYTILRKNIDDHFYQSEFKHYKTVLYDTLLAQKTLLILKIDQDFSQEEKDALQRMATIYPRWVPDPKQSTTEDSEHTALTQRDDFFSPILLLLSVFFPNISCAEFNKVVGYLLRKTNKQIANKNNLNQDGQAIFEPAINLWDTNADFYCIDAGLKAQQNENNVIAYRVNGPYSQAQLEKNLLSHRAIWLASNLDHLVSYCFDQEQASSHYIDNLSALLSQLESAQLAQPAKELLETIYRKYIKENISAHHHKTYNELATCLIKHKSIEERRSIYQQVSDHILEEVSFWQQRLSQHFNQPQEITGSSPENMELAAKSFIDYAINTDKSLYFTSLRIIDSCINVLTNAHHTISTQFIFGLVHQLLTQINNAIDSTENQAMRLAFREALIEPIENNIFFSIYDNIARNSNNLFQYAQEVVQYVETNSDTMHILQPLANAFFAALNNTLGNSFELKQNSRVKSILFGPSNTQPENIRHLSQLVYHYNPYNFLKYADLSSIERRRRKQIDHYEFGVYYFYIEISYLLYAEAGKTSAALKRTISSILKEYTDRIDPKTRKTLRAIIRQKVDYLRSSKAKLSDRRAHPDLQLRNAYRDRYKIALEELEVNYLLLSAV